MMSRTAMLGLMMQLARRGKAAILDRDDLRLLCSRRELRGRQRRFAPSIAAD